LGQFSKNYRTFTQKIVIELPKVWVWDPGSGKNLFRSRIQGSKRHRIPDTDPQHCLIVLNTVYCTRLKKWCRTLIRSLRYLQPQTPLELKTGTKTSKTESTTLRRIASIVLL